MTNFEQYNLPLGWVWTTVEQIFDIVGGGTPSTKEPLYWEGTIPWISSADIRDLKTITPRRYITHEAIANSATNLVPSGSVIVVTRVGLGKVTLAPYDLCFSQDSHALIPKIKGLNAEYILYYLSQAVQIFKYENRGTTIAGVTKRQLAELKIPLPPLPEQARIVEFIEAQLSRIEAGVAAARRAQQALRRYKASVLNAACTGRLLPQDEQDEPADVLLQRILTEQRARWEAEQRQKYEAQGKTPPKGWQERYSAPAAPDTSDLPELPRGWVWASLEQVAIVERGRFSVRPRNDPRYFGGNYPFVQIGNLPRDGGIIEGYDDTLNDLGLGVSKKFEIGTVLIAIVGATIGNTGILQFEACAPDSLVAMRSNSQTLLDYLELYWRTQKDKLRNTSYASGGQPNINLGVLNPYPIPLPAFAEQERIVAEVERRLSVVAALEHTVSATLTRAARLRQGVLRRAFRGELVAQDPTDGAAGALDSIRREKDEPYTLRMI